MGSNPGLQRLQHARVTKAMRRHIIGRLLYNPADEPRSFTHGGVPYTLPPDGPSRERFLPRDGVCKPGLVEEKGEHAIYDGTLEVFDRYGVTVEDQKRHRRAVRSGRGPTTEPEANLLLAGAEDIVTHAVRKLGRSGVTFLTGVEAEDAPAILEAKSTHITFKVAQVDRIIKNYRERTIAFHNDVRNQGSYAPPMDDHELAAQQWKDEYMLGMKATSRFVCPQNCGFQSNDESVLNRHIRASHPMTADAKQIQQEELEAAAQTTEVEPPLETQPEKTKKKAA